MHQAPKKTQALSDLKIAVLLPCFNEAAAIGQTVAGFKSALPHATVYVYDNNSSDDTSQIGRDAGAIVRTEKSQGKGNVVRRMFADIDADIYVLADGDATYDATVAPTMVRKLINEHLDMVVGTRESIVSEAYRKGHRFGNALLTGCVTWIFGQTFSDILSGYRVFSRRFVKSFPALSAGFEIETEISVHALELKMPVGELTTLYAARPVGSVSKLSTYSDGARILALIINLARIEKPVAFFGIIGIALLCLSLILSFDVFLTFYATGLVPRLPTAVLSTGIAVLAVLCITCGLILDTVTRGRREVKRLAYLQYNLISLDEGEA